VVTCHTNSICACYRDLHFYFYFPRNFSLHCTFSFPFIFIFILKFCNEICTYKGQ
jgi:hypothetical protein